MTQVINRDNDVMGSEQLYEEDKIMPEMNPDNIQASIEGKDSGSEEWDDFDTEEDSDIDCGFFYDNYKTYKGYVSNEFVEDDEFKVFDKSLKASLGMAVVFSILTVCVSYFLF